MTHTRRSFLASLACLPVAITGFLKPDNLSLLSRLRGKKVSTALYTNITTSEAVERVVDAAGWPKGQTTLQWWGLDDADAFEAVQQLRELET